MFSEEQIIKDTINALEHQSFVEINIAAFINLWFRGAQFSDKDLVVRLREFVSKHGLDYLVVLSDNRAVTNSVRLWKKSPPVVLSDILEAEVV